MSSVVFLGIDGLDPAVIDRHLDELPTLRSLARDGILTELPSIFPPDSIPAWITIFTGESPDSHGIVESIDYLAKNPAEATQRAPDSLRGRTFWDIVSAAGKRVCVVNPFMAYPAWEVNGVMVSGPVFVDSAEPSAFPTDAADGLDLPQLGGIVDFPTDRTMGAFLEQSLETTFEQAEFGLSLLARTKPDLFFMNILTIDRIQHFLWRYSDPEDPTYPGPNPLEDGIIRAYKAADEVIRRFLEASDGIVMIASDHGHGCRPPLMFYVDELLRREGLFSTGGKRQTARTYLLEAAKRTALGVAYVLGCEPQVYRLARRLPGRRALKTSSYSRSTSSVAAVSRLFGRNSAGGIDVSAALGGEERKRVVDRICSLLLDVRAPDGEPACEWALPRSEVYAGPTADRFPDVVFQLREGIGVDFGVFGSLFRSDSMHRRISGGHRRRGIFAASSPSVPFVPIRLEQLHHLVVAATGVPA